MISIRQLVYALAVEKTLHFKKAAEQCHVSQSALSTALGEMENQLGLKVFERNNKSVFVTPVGEEVLERARRIILEVEDLQRLAQGQQSPLGFPIKVGIIPTIAPYLLPLILPVLNQDYPEAQIEIIEEQSAVLVDSLRRGEIDTAILALPYDCEGLLTIEFWQEDFYWVSKRSSSQTERKEITSKEISGQNLLLLKDGHCLKDQVLGVCKLSNEQSDFYGATSLQTLIQMVKGDFGSTLIPAIAIKQLMEQHHDLEAVHLNEPSPHRRLALAFRPNYTRTNSLEALVEVCKQGLKEA